MKNCYAPLREKSWTHELHMLSSSLKGQTFTAM